MPSALVTSWKARELAGEPSSTIRVGNLQVFVTGPHDAWGRPGRPQPATVSVEVEMSKPFSISSSQDAVEADTVHYGFLSKKIQEVLDSVQHDPVGPLSLAGMVQLIWEQLTGYYLLKDAMAPDTGTSFLKKGSFRYLKIDMKLPKASLAGNGVSYTASAFMGDQDSPRAEAASVKIHHLRVPTLIGVNSNERQAKQTVIANVEIDKWIGSADEYSRIEALVTKVMEESSFETLETLLYAIASKIATHLHMMPEHQASGGSLDWRLKIGLEKPIAVPFADAPCVELSLNTSDIRPEP